MMKHRRSVTRSLVTAVVATVAVVLPAGIASAVPTGSVRAEVITDPDDGVPRIDPPITYEKYNAILDPGAGSSSYFEPSWFDTQGRHIQAHGGQIVTVEEEGETVYYWYGEDRTNGYYNSPGVGAYRSTDTKNWENLGTALRGISDTAELTEDEYFRDLYDTVDENGQPKEDLVESLSYHLNTDEDWNYSAIFERPKVLYNEENDQWVMWWHADGRTQANGSMYARSMAAVAVSDSPAGPFRMTGAYRMPNRSNYQDCTTSAVPGQARDMTVFQDTDGTAYIVYSSEENNSLYVTKLNDDYTNVVNTTSTDAVRKGSYGDPGGYLFQYSEDGQYPYIFADGGEGAPVRGTDFQIVKECGHLEAPALFTHGDRYYVLASGATGWAPNPQTYHSADSILGTWIRGVEPADQYEGAAYNSLPEGADGLLSVGDSLRTTFGSQSTNVLTLGPGKYVYMGDRWNSGKSDSTYVWLPIVVGENGKLQMSNPAVEDPARWSEGWDESYWDDQGLGSKIWSVVDADIPSSARLGASPDEVLPTTVAVSVDGAVTDVPVTWDASFAELGRQVVTGRLAGDDDFAPGRSFQREVAVWDYGVANVAPSSTVTASSRSNLAGTVVDGNNTGKGWDDWVSGGNYPKSSWLAFSWTSAQTAQEVVVHTFRDGGATWPSTVGVQYKDAAGAWVDTEVSATLDQSSEEAPSVSLDVSSLPATTGIRLQLQTETNTWQAISEVQILGTPQAQGNVCTLPGSTTAASFYQTEWQTLPSRNACDGNTSTAWSTWRGSGEYPDTESFTLTPGTAYDVSAVTFTNTEGSPQSVHVTYRGTDGLWHDAAEPTAVASNGTQTKVEFAPVTATAVRLTFATTGTFLKIPEIAVAGTLATDPAAGPSIESSAATRCVAGKGYVASSVKNTGTGSVAVEVTSAYGEKSFATVQPGATVSVAQNSRQSAIAAGTVTVTATAGGVTTQSAPYAATTCG